MAGNPVPKRASLAPGVPDGTGDVSAPSAAPPQGQEEVQDEAQEEALWRRWHHLGDAASREALVALHLPFARAIAAMAYSRRVGDGIEFDDYLQYARIGLIEAVDRYVPGGPAGFRTFAARRVRGAVLDGIANLSERQAQAALRRRVLRERTRSLAALDADGQATQEATTPRPDAFALLAEVGIGLAIGFMLEDTGMFEAEGTAAAGGPDSTYRTVELRRLGRRRHVEVARLPNAEGQVVGRHYPQPQPFEGIARDMNLSPGRVSQLHRQALRRLRLAVGAGRPADGML